MSRSKWDYKIVKIADAEDIDKLETTLNLLGDEDWELITTLDDGEVLIFKRPEYNLLPYETRRKINLEEEMN